MNSDYLLNSIYLPRKKPREVFIFPKINRPEHSPRESRMFVRGIGNKYQQNIFKMEPEKDKKVKLRIFPEETKERTKEYTRDGRSKECEQLQNSIAELIRKFQEQTKEFEERDAKLTAEIDKAKKNSFQVKLSLWETKNEVMNLTGLCRNEEMEYQRLMEQLGLQEDVEDEGERAYGEQMLQINGEENIESNLNEVRTLQTQNRNNQRNVPDSIQQSSDQHSQQAEVSDAPIQQGVSPTLANDL